MSHKKSLLEMFSYGIELRINPATNTVTLRFTASLDVDHKLPLPDDTAEEGEKGEGINPGPER